MRYRIPADRLYVRADVLDWTEKGWLCTDWRKVIRETRSGGARFAVFGPRLSSLRAV